MTMRSYSAKKGAYGGEKVSFSYPALSTSYPALSISYPALHTLGCDFDKETVKVSGVKWTSF